MAETIIRERFRNPDPSAIGEMDKWLCFREIVRDGGDYFVQYLENGTAIDTGNKPFGFNNGRLVELRDTYLFNENSSVKNAELLKTDSNGRITSLTKADLFANSTITGATINGGIITSATLAGNIAASSATISGGNFSGSTFSNVTLSSPSFGSLNFNGKPITINNGVVTTATVNSVYVGSDEPTGDNSSAVIWIQPATD